MWKDRIALVVAALLGVALLIGSVYIVLRPGEVHADSGRNGQGRTDQAANTAYRRGGANDRADTAENARGQGRGQGNGAGVQGKQRDSANLDWMTFEGVVTAFEMGDGAEMTVQTADGQDVAVGGGPSFYWTENGYSLDTGARVTVTGYYEDGEFKAAEIQNLDTKDTIFLRDDSGRPLWAGRGRGQGR
jgi:hypothetical protein